MRAPITDADLEEAELSVGSHGGTADRLVAWARDPHPDDVVSAKELLTRAGEQLELADDDAAESLYREAMTMTGEVALDPRCHLVAMLLGRGDHDDALALDRELRHSRPDAAAVYEYTAAIWEEHDDRRRALGWYNRGIRHHEQFRRFTAHDLGSLAWRRWRLREQEGHAPDDYDLVGIGWREELRRR